MSRIPTASGTIAGPLNPRAVALWLIVLSGTLALAAVAYVALSINPLLPVVVAALGVGGIVLVRSPNLGLLLTFFFFYINLQPILVKYHGLSVPLAAALPVLPVLPLLASTLVHGLRPIGSYTIVANGTVLWLCAYLGVLIASALQASDMEAAFAGVADFGIWGLAFYVLVLNSIRSEAMLRNTIWAILAAAAFLGAITLFQEVTRSYGSTFGGFSPMMGHFLDAQSADWRSRPAGPVGDPNRFAQMLLVVVPLGLFRAWAERGWRRWLAAGLTSLVTAGVFLTFSRGAGVALLLLLPATAFIWRMRVRQLLLIAGALFVIVLVAAPGFIDRMATLGDSASLVTSSDDEGTQADRSTRSRLTKNLAALNMFLDHPVLGVGPKNYGTRAHEYAAPVGLSVDIVGSYPHNLYLGLAAELGVLGLLTFFGAVGATVLNLWLVRRRFGESRSDIWNLSNALLLALAAYAFTGLFLHLNYQRYFWFLMALCGALPLIARQISADQASVPSPRAPAGDAPPAPRYTEP